MAAYAASETVRAALEREGEASEDAEVGVKLDASQAPNAERRERVVVLEASELALD